MMTIITEFEVSLDLYEATVKQCVKAMRLAGKLRLAEECAGTRSYARAIANIVRFLNNCDPNHCSTANFKEAFNNTPEGMTVSQAMYVAAVITLKETNDKTLAGELEEIEASLNQS